MNPDERVADYNRGFKAGTEHSVPAPETERRLLQLEAWRLETEKFNEEQRVFMTKLEGIPDAIKTLNDTMQQIVIQLESLKIVKSLVFGGSGLLLTAIVMALVAVIIK
jgi:hypothetical protein